MAASNLFIDTGTRKDVNCWQDIGIRKEDLPTRMQTCRMWDWPLNSCSKSSGKVDTWTSKDVGLHSNMKFSLFAPHSNGLAPRIPLSTLHIFYVTNCIGFTFLEDIAGCGDLHWFYNLGRMTFIGFTIMVEDDLHVHMIIVSTTASILLDRREQSLCTWWWFCYTCSSSLQPLTICSYAIPWTKYSTLNNTS